MRKYVISMALALALVAAYAVAQQGSAVQGDPAAQAGSASGQAGSSQYPQQPAAGTPAQGSPQEKQTGDQDRDRQDKNKADSKDKKDRENDQAADQSDEKLEREVRQQLASNPEFQAVKVAVKDRVAVLSGSVPKKEDRKEAVELAKNVQGVKRVREKLSISPAGAPAAMEGSAAEEAHENASEEAREHQQNTAGSIAGNTSAAAGTQQGVAQPGTSTPTTSTGQAGANVNINTQAQNVQQAIRSDAALGANNINVSVSNNNQIVLTGTVPSDQEKRRAEELAVAQSGGLQVINNINVGSAATAGASSGVSGGVAGAVSPQTQPTQPPSNAGAEGAVGSQAGTQTQGTTSSGAQGNTSDTGGMSPDQLKTQIQNAFQAEPTLASCNINSNVTADTVELSGTCPTGKEKQTARRMAQSLAGNRRVVDRIIVSGRGEGEEKPKQQQQGPPPQF